jgi:ketosteroid isomerase-like protein
VSEDALAIANLKAHYCATADRSAHDPEGACTEFARIFTDDVIADYGSGPLHGIPAVSAFLSTAIAGESEWMIHMLHSPRIDVSGDRATGDWTVMIHSKRRDGTRMEVVGRYADEYRRTEMGWRLAKVDFGWRA